MPQLMPLNWVLSSVMIIFLVMMSSIIYSLLIKENSKAEENISLSMNKNLWCW